MCVFHPMNMVPLEGNICRHASMHSLIQQKMYWVPNMCQVLSVTGISEKNVRYTLNLLSQLVINIQCHSSGLRVLLAASFSYIPISLADCIVIFDPVLNLYYIFYWFPSINILNIFLSFLLPPLLYFFFPDNFSSFVSSLDLSSFVFIPLAGILPPGTSYSLAMVSISLLLS